MLEHCRRQHVPEVVPGKWTRLFMSKPPDERQQELRRRGYQYRESLTYPGPGLFSAEELETLQQEDHGFCTKRLHPLRCCRCGEPGRRVGGAFSAPRQRNIKAWKQLKEMLYHGGKFDCCETWRRENYSELDIELQRERNKPAHKEERAKRIEVLRKAVELGVRTSEEETKLEVIRGLKGKGREETWAVVNM